MWNIEFQFFFLLVGSCHNDIDELTELWYIKVQNTVNNDIMKLLTKKQVDDNPTEPKKLEPKTAPRVTNREKSSQMVRIYPGWYQPIFRCFRREIYRAIVETMPTDSYLVRYTLKGPCIAVLVVGFVGWFAHLVPLVDKPMVVRVWMDFEVDVDNFNLNCIWIAIFIHAILIFLRSLMWVWWSDFNPLIPKVILLNS